MQIPTCQYFGQTTCTPPNFSGGTTALTTSSAHENFIEHFLLLGTSPLSWVINGLLWLLIIRFVVWPLVVVPFLDWLDFRHQAKAETVIYELIPHQRGSVSLEATRELLSVLHAQLAVQSYEDHLLRRRQTLALELVSTRAGIRFMARIPTNEVVVFQHALATMHRQIQFKAVEDYIKPDDGKASIAASFRQARLFIYPLRMHTKLAAYDPMAQLSQALARPALGETLAFQIVLSPYNSKYAGRVRNRLLQGKNPWLLETNGLLLLIWKGAMAPLLFVLSPFGVRSSGASGGHLVPAAQEMRSSMTAKLGEPLFYADIRAYVCATAQQSAERRVDGIASALATFAAPGYQSLIRESGVLPSLIRHFSVFGQRKVRHELRKIELRLTSAFTRNSNVLSSLEIANLYHFPYEPGTTTEGLERLTSRELPASNAMKQHADTETFDVIIGRNYYHGTETDIGLSVRDRRRHMYVVGGTGNGKTTMLEYAIVQDIRSGKGVAVIDPHGDLAEKLLDYIPKERIKDVVYLNPSDLSHPVGINLLETPEGLTGDKLANEQDFVVESIVSMFRKIFSGDDSGGHRIEYILRNAIHTAMTVEGATLFTVLRLLRNTAYRKEVTAKLADEDLRDFWREELGKAGDFQRVKMSVGISSKIDRFRRSIAVKNIVDQKKSSIDFDEILDGKILICNLAKGLIGEDTSELLGIAVLTKLQLAAYRRIRKDKEKRRPFFVYVDEFQNFATAQFMQMLSEARKYGLVVTMAEQSTAQQDRNMVEVILNNVGTIVSFRTGSSLDEQLLLPHLRPYIQEGEISSLPAYSFYARLRADKAYPPLSGSTLLLGPGDRKGLARKVITSSRKKYGIAAPVPDPLSLEGDRAKVTPVPVIPLAKKEIRVAKT